MRTLVIVALWGAPVAWAVDSDGDTVEDNQDNCPRFGQTVDQTDSDADGWGDACVHPDATVHPSVFLGLDSTVAANATVGRGVYLGGGVTVEFGAQIAPKVSIPANDVDPTRSTVIGTGSVIGRRVRFEGSGTVGAGVVVSPDATFGARPNLGDGARIGYGATFGMSANVGVNSEIGNLVTVGPRVSMGDGTRLGRAAQVATTTSNGYTVWGNNVRIGADAIMGGEGTIGDNVRVRRGANIGIGTHLHPESVFGRDAVVGANSTIESYARVQAGAEVPPNMTVCTYDIVRRGIPYTGCTLTAEECTNGIDDDGDSLIDCEDSDCSGDATCSEVNTSCSNGTDDDGDTWPDCQDPDCIGSSDCTYRVDYTQGNIDQVRLVDRRQYTYLDDAYGSYSGNFYACDGHSASDPAVYYSRMDIEVSGVAGTLSLNANGSGTADCTFQLSHAQFQRAVTWNRGDEYPDGYAPLTNPRTGLVFGPGCGGIGENVFPPALRVQSNDAWTGFPKIYWQNERWYPNGWSGASLNGDLYSTSGSTYQYNVGPTLQCTRSVSTGGFYVSGSAPIAGGSYVWAPFGNRGGSSAFGD